MSFSWPVSHWSCHMACPHKGLWTTNQFCHFHKGNHNVMVFEHCPTVSTSSQSTIFMGYNHSHRQQFGSLAALAYACIIPNMVSRWLYPYRYPLDLMLTMHLVSDTLWGRWWVYSHTTVFTPWIHGQNSQAEVRRLSPCNTSISKMYSITIGTYILYEHRSKHPIPKDKVTAVVLIVFPA